MQDEVKIVRENSIFLTTFDDIVDLDMSEYSECDLTGYYGSPRNNYLQKNLDQNAQLYEVHKELKFEDLHHLIDIYGNAFALIPSDKTVSGIKNQ